MCRATLALTQDEGYLLLFHRKMPVLRDGPQEGKPYAAISLNKTQAHTLLPSVHNLFIFFQPGLNLTM